MYCKLIIHCLWKGTVKKVCEYFEKLLNAFCVGCFRGTVIVEVNVEVIYYLKLFLRCHFYAH